MKEKLTLSVNGEVVRKARARARAEGVSLSTVVEDQLLKFAEESRGPFFVNKWIGCLAMPKRQPDDIRLNHILDKLDQATDRE